MTDRSLAPLASAWVAKPDRVECVGEPAFDLVEPAGVGRGVVQGEAGMASQPGRAGPLKAVGAGVTTSSPCPSRLRLGRCGLGGQATVRRVRVRPGRVSRAA